MNKEREHSLRPTVLLGAGGHARVVLALARTLGQPILGVCDPTLKVDGSAHWEGLTVLGGDETLSQFRPDEVDLLLGVGQLVRSNLRANLYYLWSSRGYSFPTLIHPAAWVASDAVLGDGVQIMAGAIIQPGCFLGSNTIINTRATVDHDCQIGADTHIAPGAVLCGGVRIGARTFIGAGTVIIQRVSVGSDAVVGAGVTLKRDLPAKALILD